MNKILRFIDNLSKKKESQADKVIKISNDIADSIGITPEDVTELSYPLRRFRVVRTHRFINDNWRSLFEINPLNIEGAMGYVNTQNAPWIECNGTATLNAPPYDVTDKFFKELAQELQDDNH